MATAILRWLHPAQIETAFIDPGMPWQNGTDESFNGQFRDEVLPIEWFRNRLEAQGVIERWRRHYNEERPHMSLGDQTPAEFKAKIKSGVTVQTSETWGEFVLVVFVRISYALVSEARAQERITTGPAGA